VDAGPELIGEAFGLEDDVVLCRCEDVRVADVRACLGLGARDLDAIKRLTRYGMGLCQWRYCRSALVRYLAAELGTSPEALATPRLRVPVYPVAVGALLGAEEVTAPLPHELG
jgi:NAD(P)H-nitrite reductase large subunit